MPLRAYSHLLRVSLLLAATVALSMAAAVSGRASEETPVMEAKAPQWLEQQQDAASFASDWLADLDNGDFAAAASVYTVDGDRLEMQKNLEALRATAGGCSSRSYGGAAVFAVAVDDSEHKVTVRYLSECSGKMFVESVDVLLWHREPVILAYSIEEE